MADEQKQETTQEDGNGAPTPEELAAIKAQLEAETQAKADLEASIAGKDTRIGELESELSEAKSESEAKQAALDAKQGELDQANQAITAAVAKYKEALVTANPNVPDDLISGDSIDEVFSSFQRSTAIVGKVKASLEAEAAASRVPAGAPANEGPNHGALSAREKIAQGVRTSTK